MRLNDLQVEIRSRSVGQTVAMAMRLLQERAGRLVWAWLAYSLPLLALAMLLLLGTGLSPWWVWVLVIALAPAFSLPMVVAVGHLLFSPTVTLGRIFAESARHFFVHLVVLLMQRLITALGLVAAVVPGLYLWRAGWFLGPIVVLERAALVPSMRRGRHFASGFHGLVLVHMLNAAATLIYWTGALAALLHFFIQLVGRNVAIVGDLAHYDGYPHLLGLAAFCLAVPLVTLIWFFVYLEVRTRKEGWDLEIVFRAKAEQLSGAAEQRPAATGARRG